jgi:hypothetical protein
MQTTSKGWRSVAAYILPRQKRRLVLVGHAERFNEECI